MNLASSPEISSINDAASQQKNSADTTGAIEATPAMRQYFLLKQQHPECLLFYRMGDFYELFFDDAVEAAAILDIALTRRGKHAGQDIPMCGVPVHSAESYLHKLIAKGKRVAVCEQLEGPEEARKRGNKSVVKRDVVRVITPGTLSEDSLLDARRKNLLAALSSESGNCSIACCDMSTGEFTVSAIGDGQLADELARLQPAELLVADGTELDEIAQEQMPGGVESISFQPVAMFSPQRGERALKEYFAVQSLESFGDFSVADISACGALLEYLKLTQKDVMPRLDPPGRQERGTLMVIDPATRRNLELTHTTSGERKGSLLHTIDNTITSLGARLLVGWVSAPLTDAVEINKRLDSVSYVLNDEALREDIREHLQECPDLERALSRLCLGRGGPRDMLAIARGLEVAYALRERLGGEMSNMALHSMLQASRESLGYHSELVDYLRSVLKDEPPLLARDGNFVRSGYSPPLDEMRKLRDHSREMIAELQERYQRESTIPSLKVKFNNVLGYYIEITQTHQHKVPEHFIHRQTMKNALRYTTVELGELESKMRAAGDRALKLELEIFNEIIAKISAAAESISRAARALAEIDVIASLAELAHNHHYSRPTVDSGYTFDVKGGRHPVVEAFMNKSGDSSFIGNNCRLEKDSGRLWLLTGPNMAGKSTFLRQNAIIMLLAQIGSFVPANSAHIGVVDRLFSRVGAADDLARGRSTFMVEMVETATILNQATERSLVILDEIGRGTSTYDGLSIAWAVVEHLHEATRCRGLFATHYHELTKLADRLPSLACYSMQVREWKNRIVFLHTVMPGTADRSYGIHVAELAGLPEAVTRRAGQVLRELEAEQKSKRGIMAEPLPLFSLAEKPAPFQEPEPSPLEEMLDTLNPDDMTPKQALEAMYKLKKELTGDS